MKRDEKQGKSYGKSRSSCKRNPKKKREKSEPCYVPSLTSTIFFASATFVDP